MNAVKPSRRALLKSLLALPVAARFAPAPPPQLVKTFVAQGIIGAGGPVFVGYTRMEFPPNGRDTIRITYTITMG